MRSGSRGWVRPARQSPSSTTRLPAPHPKPASRPPPPPRGPATLALTSAATAVALMTYTAPMVTLPETAAALHTPPGRPGLAPERHPAGPGRAPPGRRHPRRRLRPPPALRLRHPRPRHHHRPRRPRLHDLAVHAGPGRPGRGQRGPPREQPRPDRPRAPDAGREIRATGVWGAFVSGGIALGPVVAGAIPNWRVAYGVLGAALADRGGPGGPHADRIPRPARRPPRPRSARWPSDWRWSHCVAALTLGRDGWLRAPVGLSCRWRPSLLLGLFAVVERTHPNADDRPRSASAPPASSPPPSAACSPASP